jgi:protein-S-isoprenylcysteine O-methyltransferase Ste14
MITVSPELLATMRMLPRLLVIAAVSAAFVLPAASFVRKSERPIKKSNADSTPSPSQAGATPLSPSQKLLQPLQLAAAVGLLVELPCYACRRPALGWRLSIEYFTFFAVVTLPRSYRFGKYSERAAEPAKGAGGGDFAQFLLSVWAAHWLGAWRGARGCINARELFALRIAGTAIGACAAWTLGRAYDRVVTPESLVTTGPYRFVRHPIYTAYLFLFAGGLASLGSPLAVAVLLWSARRFYVPRMASEDKILESEFGDAWRNYAAKTPSRLLPPFV